jgi:hypothetical protein
VTPYRGDATSDQYDRRVQVSTIAGLIRASPISRLDVGLAAAATLIAAAFTLSTFDRWLRRRKPQELAWTVSLGLFALGSAALWWGFARGWSGASFRAFYLCGAILNVPWLALGSVHLVAPRWGAVGHRWLVWSSGLATGVVLAAPMKAAVPADGMPAGKELFGAWPRVLAAVGSGVAALVIVGIAVATTVQLVRHRARFGPRVAGNVLIALGTIVLSASGTVAGRLGEARAFVVTLLAGIVVLFAGFLVANGRARRPYLELILATEPLVGRPGVGAR